MSEQPFVDLANQYIADVLSGKIPACKYVKQACQRQLDDLTREGSEEFPYWFSVERAEHVCRFISLLPHIKGKWARERRKIELEPWQAFKLTTVFGWIDAEGLRRFRTVYDEVARKNAKSTGSAGVALYLLMADDEEGSEVYSAATTRDQAKIVWQDAKKMVEKSPGMQERFGVDTAARSVFVKDSSSVLQPLSRDQGGNLDGLNVHGGIVDELHAHKTRDVFDVIETGMGAREQPLLWLITTAGFNRAGICYEQRAYVVRILGGQVVDDSYFGIIYTVDEADLENRERLLSDPEIWKKANPNWDVSVNPVDMERLARKARAMTSAQNNFLTKRLNVWVNADSAWLDMVALEKCVDTSLDLADFEGSACYGGLDLASKLDIASKALLFVRDGHYYFFGKHYLPEDTIEESSNSQYQGWAQDHYLTETPGSTINYDTIEEDILDDSRGYELLQMGFDPTQATQMVSHMIDEGLEMVEVRPTVLNFSEPMKELEALIVAGRFHYDGNPAMTWMFSNVVCHTDAKDNIYPRKEFAENKIDGVVALVTALALALRAEGGSVYDTEDLLVL